MRISCVLGRHTVCLAKFIINSISGNTYDHFHCTDKESRMLRSRGSQTPMQAGLCASNAVSLPASPLSNDQLPSRVVGPVRFAWACHVWALAEDITHTKTVPANDGLLCLCLMGRGNHWSPKYHTGGTRLCPVQSRAPSHLLKHTPRGVCVILLDRTYSLNC